AIEPIRTRIARLSRNTELRRTGSGSYTPSPPQDQAVPVGRAGSHGGSADGVAITLRILSICASCRTARRRLADVWRAGSELAAFIEPLPLSGSGRPSRSDVTPVARKSMSPSALDQWRNRTGWRA